MNVVDQELIAKVSPFNTSDSNAYNVRKDGKLLIRNITEDVSIISKEDGSGIDIYIKDNTKNALVFIPVIITKGGINDKVYNDFHIGKNAKATIMAGCAIRNNKNLDASHNGIHRFYLDEGAKVKYVEKHYADGHGQGHKTLDPITELYLGRNSSLEIDTVQISGVDSSNRITTGKLEDGATLSISEKIMTEKKQFAMTDFNIDLDGIDSSCHVVSRSVAKDDSKQVFKSNINGNNKCYGHVECDAIIQDNGHVHAIPEINAENINANLVHEATIGKIAGEQLIKLMSLGLSLEEAEAQIINGFLK